MTIGLIGKKLGMTREFFDSGMSVPVTVVKIEKGRVLDIFTKENRGYNAVRIGFGNIKTSKLTKAMKGVFAKKATEAKKILKEYRVDNVADFKEGNEIGLEVLKDKNFVDVTSKTIGKGFAGHMKRHGFGGGRRSHGKNSVMRKAGSIGAGSDPSRVWKGTRMAGRMGGDNISIKNMAIMKVDLSKNLLYLKGSVPGANKGMLFISK